MRRQEVVCGGVLDWLGASHLVFREGVLSRSRAGRRVGPEVGSSSQGPLRRRGAGRA